MTEIGREAVAHVARLARLLLSDDEIERLRRELGDILGHIDVLRQLDTRGVEPTSHAVPLLNVMRADEPRPCMPQAAMLANAPDRVDDFFRVPRIIED